MIPLCEMSKIGKSIEREKELVVTRDSGEVGVGSNCLLSMGCPVGVIKTSATR